MALAEAEYAGGGRVSGNISDSQAVTDILFCRFIAYTSDYDALKHTVKRAESRLASRDVTKEPTASISGGASPGVNMHS